MSAYSRAFELVVGHEGGMTRDPRDRGNWTTGRIGHGVNKGTKYGITAMAYPHLDIANLTIDDAKGIYVDDYWTPAGCKSLPEIAAYPHFDASVNHGVSRAIKFLQGAIGAGPDGIIGPQTRRKIQEANPRDMFRNMLALRIKFYMDLDHLNDIYGLGWSRRSVDVIMDAMDMARPSTAPATPSASDLLAAYINHKDVVPGSPQHTIAGALRDLT